VIGLKIFFPERLSKLGERGAQSLRFGALVVEERPVGVKKNPAVLHHHTHLPGLIMLLMVYF
jgi:hypothetical protein